MLSPAPLSSALSPPSSSLSSRLPPFTFSLVFKRRRPIFVAVACLAICAAVLFFWRDDCLVAENGKTVLFARPIRAGESFEVTYTHSLNLSPVTDVVEWTGADLVVRKSMFKTFGAGIPLPADFAGSELLFKGDHYELVGIDKHMPGFVIVTQKVPNHKITFDGRETCLLDIAESGAPIYITVKPLSFIARLMASG